MSVPRDTTLKVLIVDDSMTIRAMIDQIVLGDPGSHVVGAASDSAEAILLLDTLYPNVITLDLAMPGGGGMAFLDHVNGRPHAPVVVLSSGTTEGAAATSAAIERGAAACFDKAKVVSEARRFLALLKRVADGKAIAQRPIAL